MNKGEIVAAIAKKVNLSKTDVEKVLSAFLDLVTGTLKKGSSIVLIGFGTFLTRKRKARTGRNPQTGKKLNIPATRVAAFKVGSKLKAAVAKK